MKYGVIPDRDVRAGSVLVQTTEGGWTPLTTTLYFEIRDRVKLDGVAGTWEVVGVRPDKLILVEDETP